MLTQEVLRELPVIADAGTVAGFTTVAVPLTILLVEDDDDLRQLMGVFLTLSGFAVTSYSNAQLALEAFCKSPATPDLLLTDIEMPGMTGIELARELTSRRPLLPVVIVSASWISPAASSEFQSRGWKFLCKPVSPPLVLNAIRVLLPACRKSVTVPKIAEEL